MRLSSYKDTPARYILEATTINGDKIVEGYHHSSQIAVVDDGATLRVDTWEASMFFVVANLASYKITTVNPQDDGPGLIRIEGGAE